LHFSFLSLPNFTINQYQCLTQTQPLKNRPRNEASLDGFSCISQIISERKGRIYAGHRQEIEILGDELLKIAGEETNLPEARLRNERTRTMFQLTSYADACERGDWRQDRYR
jgi:hypothetical protein